MTTTLDHPAVGVLDDAEPVPRRAGSSGRRLSNLNIDITPKRVPKKDLAHFSRQMAVFVRAGVPLLDALETIHSETTQKYFSQVLGHMIEALRTGATFSDAMSLYPDAFPPYYLGIVRSAELTGRLDDVMFQLSEYIDRDIETRSKVTSALVYPAVICALSVVTVIILVSYVLPKFQKFFAGLHAKLPLPTRMLLSIGHFFGSYGLLVLGGGIAVVVSALFALQTTKGQHFRDRLMLRLPVIGGLVQFAILERFCRLLSAMSHSGVPLDEALIVAGGASANVVYRNGLSNAREGMLRGEGLSGPLGETGLFPPAARQMLRVGEETGTLDDQMASAAMYFDRELDYKLKRFTSLFEPAVLIVVGLVVGFVAIALVSAMYGIFNQVKV